MKNEPEDITPKDGKFVWEGQDPTEFADKWSFKPVKVRGFFDNDNEMRVSKEVEGERGFEIVTPFYTHVDKDGVPQGFLVDRGWVPMDLAEQNYHKISEKSYDNI